MPRLAAALAAVLKRCEVAEAALKQAMSDLTDALRWANENEDRLGNVKLKVSLPLPKVDAENLEVEVRGGLVLAKRIVPIGGNDSFLVIWAEAEED